MVYIVPIAAGIVTLLFAIAFYYFLQEMKK